MKYYKSPTTTYTTMTSTRTNNTIENQILSSEQLEPDLSSNLSQNSDNSNSKILTAAQRKFEYMFTNSNYEESISVPPKCQLCELVTLGKSGIKVARIENCGCIFCEACLYVWSKRSDASCPTCLEKYSRILVFDSYRQAYYGKDYRDVIHVVYENDIKNINNDEMSKYSEFSTSPIETTEMVEKSLSKNNNNSSHDVNRLNLGKSSFQEKMMMTNLDNVIQTASKPINLEVVVKIQETIYEEGTTSISSSSSKAEENYYISEESEEVICQGYFEGTKEALKNMITEQRLSKCTHCHKPVKQWDLDSEKWVLESDSVECANCGKLAHDNSVCLYHWQKIDDLLWHCDECTAFCYNCGMFKSSNHVKNCRKMAIRRRLEIHSPKILACLDHVSDRANFKKVVWLSFLFTLPIFLLILRISTG